MMNTLIVSRHLRSRLLVAAGPVRTIYVKDNKELDKSKYKPNELDQLENYVKNYILDDPKSISEEEKQKLLEQAAQLNAKPAAADKTQKLHVTQSEVKASETVKTPEENKAAAIDPSQIKDIMDKMTEIDSDPNSKRAQEYYKKLEELERKNPNKKKSSIIIKTMKRGRTAKVEMYQDGRFIG